MVVFHAPTLIVQLHAAGGYDYLVRNRLQPDWGIDVQGILFTVMI